MIGVRQKKSRRTGTGNTSEETTGSATRKDRIVRGKDVVAGVQGKKRNGTTQEEDSMGRGGAVEGRENVSKTERQRKTRAENDGGASL